MNQSDYGTFASVSTFSQSESGSAAFSISDDGEYVEGVLGFSRAALNETASASFTTSRAEAYSDTLTGTYSNSGVQVNQSISATGSYSRQDSTASSDAQSGSVIYTLIQVAALDNGEPSLSCYAYSSSSAGTFSSFSTSTAVEAGTGFGVQSGTSAATTGTGFDSSLATTYYEYASASTSAYSDNGSQTESKSETGSFASGQFALESTAYSQISSDTWSMSGTDVSSSSGTITSTGWGSQQNSTAGGVSGVDALTSATYSQASTGTFTSASSEASSQSGTSDSAYAFNGNYATFAFGNVLVAYQYSVSQTGTMVSSGADTFVGAGNATASSWSNQGAISPDGPTGTSTLAGIGTFTADAFGTFSQVKSDAWTQTLTGASNFTLFEAGSFAAGSWSLSSVAFGQESNDSWSYSQTDTADFNGTDSMALGGVGSVASTSSSSGQSARMFGVGSYMEQLTDAYSGSASATLNQSGTDTSSLTETGTFSGNSFSFASVVFQSASTQSSTYEMAGQSASVGTGTSGFTSAYGAGSWVSSTNADAGTFNAVRQNGQSTFVQGGVETYSQSTSANSSSSLYEAGSFAVNDYAFTSVSYSEESSSSYALTDSQAHTESGADAWTGTNFARHRSAATTTDQISSTRDRTIIESTFSDQYQNAVAADTSVTGTASSTLTAQGEFSDGAFSFDTWTYDATGSESGTLASTTTSTYDGAGTDSATSSATQNAQSPDGYSNINGQASFTQSGDSYTQSGTQVSVQTESYSASDNLHLLGSLIDNQWSLSSVAYTANSNSTQALAQTFTSDEAGSEYEQTTATQSSSLINSLITSTSLHSANGNYSVSMSGSLEQTTTSSDSLSESGSYSPTVGYTFDNVVVQSSSVANGAGLLSSSSTESQTASNSIATTTVTTMPGQWTSGSNGTSYSASTFTSITSIGTTSSAVGTTDSTLTSVYSNAASQYQAGSYSAGSFAFTSVTLDSSGNQCIAYQELSTTTTLGTEATSTFNSRTSTNTTLRSGADTYGSSTETLTSTQSLFSTTAANLSFTETSTSTYTEAALSTFAFNEQGSFSNDSYAFGSFSLSNEENAASTLMQTDVTRAVGTVTTINDAGADSTDSLAVEVQQLMGGGTIQNTFLTQDASAQSSTDTATLDSTTTAVLQDSQSTQASLYLVGSYALDSTSLSCVAYTEASAETSAETSISSNTLTGSNSSYSAATYTYMPSDGSLSSSALTMQFSEGTFVRSSFSTLQQTTTSGATFAEAGSIDTLGNGTFTSLVSQTAHASAATLQSASVESWTERSGSTFTKTQSGNSLNTFTRGMWTLQTEIENFSGQTQTTTSFETGLATLNITENTTESSSYYAAGSYASAADDYSLSSVNYQASSTALYSVNKDSSVTAVGSNSSSQASNLTSTVSVIAPGNLGTFQSLQGNSAASAFSFTDTSQKSQAETGLLSVSFTEQGAFSGGSYAFGTVTYDAIVRSRVDANVTVTEFSTRNDATANATASRNTGIDVVNGMLDSNSSFNNSDYTSTATTTMRDSLVTSTEQSFQTMQLHEAGAYSGDGFALSSIAYDETHYDRTCATDNSLFTQVVDNTTARTISSVSMMQTSAGTLNIHNVATAVSSITTSLESQSQSSLHEVGTEGDTLSSVQYDATGNSSFTETNLTVQTDVETVVATDVLAASQFLIPDATGTSTVYSRSVATSQLDNTGAYTVSQSERGNYAGGSFVLTSVVFSDTSVSNQSFSLLGLTTSSSSIGLKTVDPPDTSSPWPGTTSDDSVMTQTDSASCFQYSFESLYADGYSSPSQTTAAGYSLTSYNLYSAGSMNAASAMTRTSTTAINNYSGTGAVTGNGSSGTTLTQTNFQSLATELLEQGRIEDGHALLSVVNFAASGASSFSYNYTSTNNYSLNASGYDSTSVNASGAGSFSANGTGTAGVDGVGNPLLSLTYFRLDGGSTSHVTLTQGGAMDCFSYGHSKSWTETTTLHELGSDYVNASTGNSWSFQSYVNTNVTKRNDSSNVDQTTLEGNTVHTHADAQSTVTVSYSCTGAPTNGTRSEDGDATWILNFADVNRDYAAQSSESITATVPTINFATIIPTGAPMLWAATSARKGSLPSVFADMADALRDVAGGDSKLYAALHSSGAFASVKVLVSTFKLSYGGWFGPNAPGADPLTPQFLPQIFLAPGDAHWQAYAKSMTDALNEALVSLHMDPLQLLAMGAAGPVVGGPNASVTKGLWAQIGELKDAAYATINRVSNGLFDRAMRAWGRGRVVDKTSDGYKEGEKVGEVLTAVLIAFGGPLGQLVTAMQIAGHLLNAQEAYANGDKFGVILELASAAALLPGLKGQGLSNASRSNNRILGGARAEDFNAVKANVRAGRIDCRGVVRSTSEQITGCFGPGTLLQTPYGPRRIEEIGVGEFVLSAPEDGVGEPRYCAVEHVFRRYAAVIEIHVLGGVIKATPEHPFWVEGAGWTTAWDLQPGDALRNEAGTTVVLSVLDRGEAIPVYNLSVAEYHTYYVLPAVGEAGVWSHNVYNATKPGMPQTGTRAVRGAKGKPVTSRAIIGSGRSRGTSGRANGTGSKQPQIRPGQVGSAYPRGRRVGGNREGRRSTDPRAGKREKGAWDLTPENLRRMERGQPPIGRDGLKVELHHRGQRPRGPLDEMRATTHDGVPHPRRPTAVDRARFRGERRRYWIQRARELMGQP